MLHDFIRTIEALQGNALSAPVFLFLYGGACFIAPVSIFPVAGGVLFGFGGGLVINLCSALMGASGAFFLARRMGRERLDPLLRRWERDHPLMKKLDNPDPATFILIRLVGFPPFVITNYLAGFSRMTWVRFLWTSLLGLFPWTFVLTFFAETFWKVLRESGLSGFRQALWVHSRPLWWGIGVLAALFLGFFSFNYKKIKSDFFKKST